MSGLSAGSLGTGGRKVDSEHVFNTMGNPDATQLDRARQLIALIPAALADEAREPYSAIAIVYLLLLDADTVILDRQLMRLAASADINLMLRQQDLLPLRDQINPAIRLPLLELTIPALRQLMQRQYVLFKDNVDALIRAD